MRNLRKRLARLETQFGAAGILAPHTPEWVDYWVQRLLRIERGEEVAERRSIPLEAYRAMVALANEIDVPPTEVRAPIRHPGWS
jgi:hypothetical protein